MGNPVVHFEIGCRDLEKTSEFYSKLFDWTISPMGPAAMISSGDKGISGHMTALGHEPHQYTIFYVEVADIVEALKKAESLGGKKLVGPVPIPTGSFAWFVDPGGNTVGLMQPKTPPA
jgi:predicted enzyme related to lactoylglutathione lyase